MKDNTKPLESPLDKINRHHGMTVPEGYFEEFAKRMEESLSEMPFEKGEAEKPVAPGQRSLWQKIRPYVYMAAMFAGIWCMMQVFDNVRNTPTRTTMEVKQNPVLAEALSNDQFVDQYFYNELSDDDLMWLDEQDEAAAEDEIVEQNSAEE